ncbi:hypothetical protein IW261DRAFT_1612337 [Armillaria novae-zelandiae]|uniref:Ubiquitin-like domain-containing protein n=1 Tax=Armillaria novae-zelandiae TaxID=153914 RepID=A0AA39TV67_9AGAR|nr:hypothetical protein IW261DRAFT_1612337 [Armillaria novae-zelandiae]
MGATQSKDYIIATDDTITVLVRRREVTRYQDLIATLLHHFPTVNEEFIVVQTNEMDICAGRYADIPSDLWSDISHKIHNIKVISRPPQEMTIYVQTLTGEKVPVMVLRSDTVSDVAKIVHECKGIPVVGQYFNYQGEWLSSDCKLSSYNIREGAILHHVEWALTSRFGRPIPDDEPERVPDRGRGGRYR